MTQEHEGGIIEPPIDQLVRLFIDTSEKLPQNLVGVGSVMNLRAMQLLDQGGMTWEEFASSQLEGNRLNKVVAQTIALHDEVGGGSTDDTKLRKILPHVYRFTINSFITSVAELAKGDAGQLLEKLTVPTDEDTAFTRAYLFDGEYAGPHRQQVISLLESNTKVITDPTGSASDIGEAYREALLGKSSEGFPAADRETTGDKKERLAQHFRPLLKYNAQPLVLKGIVSSHKLDIFTHNITRP